MRYTIIEFYYLASLTIVRTLTIMNKKLNVDIYTIIKTIFFIMLSIAILIAFITEFESFFQSDLFSWFYRVESKGWLDFFLVLIGLFYLSIKVEECKVEIPNDKVTFLLFLLMGIYTYERFFNTVFQFTHFHWKFLSKMVYLDLLYLIILLRLASYLKQYLPTQNEGESTGKILEDLPLSSSDDDGLDGLLRISSNKILNIIKNNQFKNSFAIGLNGEWGDGKTSVFNFVKKDLSNDNIIIVDFNPWMGYDKKVLIKDFFNSLSEGLGSDLSMEISKYVEEILNNGEDSGIINFVKSLIKEDESIHNIYTQINKKIEQLNKKIVVFIDDVDRLDREEIFELLKLIRNTANFSNVFFIVAYDRMYVNESIKHQSSETTVKYLDKIINVEISLPYFDKFLLKYYFLEKLENLVPENLKYKINYFKERYEKDPLLLDLGYEENDLFEYWLSNFRDIKKILNSLFVNFHHLYGDINFNDVILLEILKLKHPSLYRLLFKKKDIIFNIDIGNDLYYFVLFDRKRAQLKRIEFLLPMANDDVEDDRTVFEIYLDLYCDENSINGMEKNQILDLIKRLFPCETDTLRHAEDSGREGHLSVRYISKFERYFSQTIFDLNFSDQDFDKFVVMTTEEFDKKIEHWIEGNKVKSLTWTLNKYNSFISRVEYQNIVEASYKLLYKNVSGNMIDFYVLVSKFVDKDFIRLFGSLENARVYFKDFFVGSKSEYYKSSAILYELLKKNGRRSDGEFPFSSSEIFELLRSIIQKFLKDKISFCENFWGIYYKGLWTGSDGRKTPYDTIENDLKESLDCVDRIEDFLRSLILYHDHGYKLRNKEIIEIFGSYDSFENLIFEDHDTSKIISEFEKFYNEVRDNDWDLVNFQFDEINVDHLD